MKEEMMIKSSKMRKYLSIILGLMLVITMLGGIKQDLYVYAETNKQDEQSMTITSDMFSINRVKGDKISGVLTALNEKNEAIPYQNVIFKVNGKRINHVWQNGQDGSQALGAEISYNVPLDIGENNLEISIAPEYLGSITFKPIKHKIIREKVGKNEVIGHFLMRMEGTSIGYPTLIETTEIPITIGKNAAQYLTEWLTNNGLTYTHTGTLGSDFYLASVGGFSGVFKIPDALYKDASKRYELPQGEKFTDLGEFTCGRGSGWMYSGDDIFPNFGFANYYPTDGDVIRVQYTIALGTDIGGGSTITGDGESYFPIAKKSPLVKAIFNSKKVENPSEAYKYLIKVANKTMDDIQASQEMCDTLTSDLGKPDKIQGIRSVDSIDKILVPFGTEKSKISWPKKVNVVTEDGKTNSCDIVWDKEKYNPNKEGIQEIPGSIKLPQLVYADNSIKMNIEVEKDDGPASIKEMTLVSEDGKTISKGLIEKQKITLNLPWNFDKKNGQNLILKGEADKDNISVEGIGVGINKIEGKKFECVPHLFKDSTALLLTIKRGSATKDYTVLVKAPADATRGIKTVKGSKLDVKENDKKVIDKLPKTVEVTYTDGKTDELKVDWELSKIDFTKAGKYKVKGKITPKEAMIGEVPDATLDLNIEAVKKKIVSVNPIEDIETYNILNPEKLCKGINVKLSDGTERFIPIQYWKTWALDNPEEAKQFYNRNEAKSGIVKVDKLNYPEDIEPLSKEEEGKIQFNIIIKEKEVDMPDDNLRNMILNAIGKKDKSKITNIDINQWSQSGGYYGPVIEKMEVNSFKGLEFFTGDKLSIKNATIPKDALEVVSTLDSFDTLTLENIRGIDSLQGLKMNSLRSLNIFGGASINNIGDLKYNNNLERLVIKDSKITSVEGLENLKKLRFVELHNLPLDDLTPIQKVFSTNGNPYNILWLYSLPLKNLDFLDGIYLEQLRIGGGHIADISGLSKAKAITNKTSFAISNQEVTFDKDIYNQDFIMDNPLRDSKGDLIEIINSDGAKNLKNGKIQLFPEQAKDGNIEIAWKNARDVTGVAGKFEGKMIIPVKDVKLNELVFKTKPENAKVELFKNGLKIKPFQSEDNEIYKVPDGTYNVKATQDGYKDYEETLTVQENRIINIKFEPLNSEQTLEALQKVIDEAKAADTKEKTDESVKCLNEEIAKGEALIAKQESDNDIILKSISDIKLAVNNLANKAIIQSVEVIDLNGKVVAKGDIDQQKKKIIVNFVYGVSKDDAEEIEFGFLSIKMVTNKGTLIKSDLIESGKAEDLSKGMMISIDLDEEHIFTAVNGKNKVDYTLIVNSPKEPEQVTPVIEKVEVIDLNGKVVAKGDIDQQKKKINVNFVDGVSKDDAEKIEMGMLQTKITTNEGTLIKSDLIYSGKAEDLSKGMMIPMDLDEEHIFTAVNGKNKVDYTLIVNSPKEKPADKTALRQTIEKAKTLLDETKYTENSLNALRSAIDEAEKINAQENASQNAVNAAKTALDNAIASLEEALPIVEKVNIKIDPNGGIGEIISIQIDKNHEYTLPENQFTAPEGKTFKAWQIGAEIKSPGEKLSASEDIIVKAIWEDEQTEKPAEPEQPEGPDKPVEPNQPEDPSNPVEPNKPSEPIQPEEPNNPVEPNKPDLGETYKFVKGSGKGWIEGTNGNWLKNSGKELDFRVNGPFAEFLEIQVDNKIVARENYTVEEGSTIIHLKPEYLEKLAEGQHTLTAIYKNGRKANTTFTISSADNGETINKSSNTSDSSILNLWIGITTVLACALITILMKKKKTKNNI